MNPVVSRVLVAKGLRAFGDGYVSLLLPAYLLELGRSPLEVTVCSGYLFSRARSTRAVELLRKD